MWVDEVVYVFDDCYVGNFYFFYYVDVFFSVEQGYFLWSCDYYSCIKGDVLGNGEDFVVGFRWEVDYYEVKFFLFCIFKELFYGFGYEGIVLYDRLIFWNEEVYVYDFDRSYLIYEVCYWGDYFKFFIVYFFGKNVGFVNVEYFGDVWFVYVGIQDFNEIVYFCEGGSEVDCDCVFINVVFIVQDGYFVFLFFLFFLNFLGEWIGVKFVYVEGRSFDCYL